MNTNYLTARRIESLKIYLQDCEKGIDTVLAWKTHKTRIKTEDGIAKEAK